MANPDTFLNLTSDEKRAVEKISAHSGVGELEVIKVFRSLFDYTSREIIEGNNSIRLPYFMKIDFDYKIHEIEGIYRLVEKFRITPTEPLHELLINVHNGKKTWLHQHLISGMKRSLSYFLPSSKNKPTFVKEDEPEFKYAG